MSRRPRQTLFLAGLSLGSLPGVYLAFGLFDALAYGPQLAPPASAFSLRVGLLAGAAIGLAALWRPLRRWACSHAAVRVWFALLPLALLASAVELVTGIYLRFHFPPDTQYSSDRLDSPLYAGFDWTREVIEAGSAVTYTYAPFRVWRARGMGSAWMNIDTKGNRYTTAPGHIEGAPPFRVQIYGGSTVFCLEAPDEFTLASCLARALAERLPDRNVVVENLGVPAYVREQEWIWFNLKLNEGPKPDLAIFYDGANDMITSGWLGARHNKMEQFENAMAGDDLRIRALGGSFFFTYTNLGRFILIRRLLPRPPDPAPGEEEISERARRAAERFVRLGERIRRTAASEGIATAFFLQPTLRGKSERTAREGVFIDYEYYIRPGIGRLDEIFRGEIVRREAELGRGDFHDLGSIFASRREDAFFDLMHVGPRENELLAAEMARRLESILPAAGS